MTIISSKNSKLERNIHVDNWALSKVIDGKDWRVKDKNIIEYQAWLEHGKEISCVQVAYNLLRHAFLA